MIYNPKSGCIFHQISFPTRLCHAFPDLCRDFPRTGDEGRTVTAPAVTPGLEIVFVAIFSAQGDHLTRLVNRTRRAALDTGRAAAV